MAHSITTTTTPPATTVISYESKKKPHLQTLGFQRVCSPHHAQARDDRLVVHRRFVYIVLPFKPDWYVPLEDLSEFGELGCSPMAIKEFTRSLTLVFYEYSRDKYKLVGHKKKMWIRTVVIYTFISSGKDLELYILPISCKVN